MNYKVHRKDLSLKVVGLITEYNPFHNGHKYHIDEAKRITGADYVIAVMSGDFVQRGAPAIIDKYSRSEMALRNGVDLVFELPVCYATSSAEFFAHGAVSLLDKLGLIDYLCFGSEWGDIRLLQDAATFLLNTPAAFDERLQAFLKDGLTYPAARVKALEATFTSYDNTMDGHALTKVLSEPNNILGIEYIKALKRFSSSIIPVTIKRIAAHYHDTELAKVNKSPEQRNEEAPGEARNHKTISSATAIRRAVQHADNTEHGEFVITKDSVPQDVFQFMQENYRKTYPITEEDFAEILKYKLLMEDNLSLSQYVDISADMADRLKNISDYNKTITELIHMIKTKNMTLTRINRAMIHLLLNIRSDSFLEYNQNGFVPYARVLGIRKEASPLLRKIEQAASIPIIKKVSKAKEQLDVTGMRMLSEDLFAAHIYNQAVYEKYKTSILNEYKHGICII
jgi:predicted nucleotidyltransferase